MARIIFFFLVCFLYPVGKVMWRRSHRIDAKKPCYMSPFDPLLITQRCCFFSLFGECVCVRAYFCLCVWERESECVRQRFLRYFCAHSTLYLLQQQLEDFFLSSFFFFFPLPWKISWKKFKRFFKTVVITLASLFCFVSQLLNFIYHLKTHAYRVFC